MPTRTTDIALTYTIEKGGSGVKALGDNSAKLIDKILHKKSPLFSSGFIDIKPLIQGSTVIFKIPLRAIYKEYSTSGAADTSNFAVVQSSLHIDRYDIFTAKIDSQEQSIFTNAGAMKASILSELLQNQLKLISARLYKTTIDSLKDSSFMTRTLASDGYILSPAAYSSSGVLADGKINPSFEWDPTDLTKYPKTIEGNNKLLADLMSQTIQIERLIDNFTSGIEMSNLVAFISPEAYNRLALAYSTIGHTTKLIEGDPEVQKIIISGLTLVREPLLNTKYAAGLLHKTDAFDFTDIHALIAVKPQSGSPMSITSTLAKTEIYENLEPTENNPISGIKFSSANGIVLKPFANRIRIGTKTTFTY